MSTAHLPTTAKVGLRTQGLTADNGQAESAKQMAPFPLDSDTAAGITRSTRTTTPSAKVGMRLAELELVVMRAPPVHVLDRGSVLAEGQHAEGGKPMTNSWTASSCTARFSSDVGVLHSTGGKPLEAQVLDEIRRHLQAPVQPLHAHTLLMDDLGADSLALAELTLVLEETFDIDISNEEAEAIRNVRDAVVSVERNLRAQRRA